MTQRREHGERRCLVARCERRVQPGTAVCRDHARTEEGKGAMGAVREMADRVAGTAALMAAGDGERAAGEFGRRIERGDYAALLDRPMQAIVDQAGEALAVGEEIGTLRVAAKRLLLEEQDPSKMALGLSRLAHAVARLVTVEERRRAKVLPDDPVTEMLRQLIATEET